MRRLLPMLPLAALLLPFAVGVMLTTLQSLGIGVPAGGAQGGLSLYGWRTLLHGGAADSLLYGVRVAGLSAAISVVLGMVAAYGVWRLPRRWQWAGLLPRVPLILPHIAVAWLVVLVCARSGVLSSLSYALGMTAGQGDFPALLYGGDGWGMIIAYVWKETPFVMLLVVASLRRLDPRLVEMGRMLGGGRWRTFRAVVLPHVAPVLRVCLVILFLYALGAVEVPFVLGETRPVMPGIAAYNAFFHGDFAGRPAAMALLSALFVFGVGVVALYAFLEGRCLSGLLTGRVMGRAQDGRLPSDPMQDGYPSGRQRDWRHSGDLLSSACRWAAMRAASVPDVRGRRWFMGGQWPMARQVSLSRRLLSATGAEGASVPAAGQGGRMEPRAGGGTLRTGHGLPHSRFRSQESVRPALVTAALVVVFVLPLLALVVQVAAPVWSWPDLWPRDFSPRTVLWLMDNGPVVMRHLAWSVWYALLTTGLCLVVCLLPARALAFGLVPSGPLVEGLLLSPALLPAMGFALGLYGVFVRSGLADTTVAVVLVLAVVSFPYMLRALMVGWQTVGPDYARCAANLGAGPLRTLLAVELPLLLPAVVAGGSVVFLVAFSDYFLVYLVGGGLVPSFTGFLFPVLQSGDRSLAALLTLVFMAVPVLLFVLVEGLTLYFMHRRGM
ncbi:ABC transporter permease subunit [Nitratidesulfovibrio vulgaris]|uniref:Binding-protein-dependent transport systems inner membrane component n=1 Tax=Nitratidesulfovibrio vulgaris (strain DP4) TaxID=391774 RepID=A0A0H3A4D4_NITV4|nr:ABC transporter permease subunit [Nitratidesulfovibrio vulgaris]ABM27328.1 binding-protein-dependent transport systems inner membrane component [Nitratidesulfovibrio vulgaris DP4]GEB80231.1 ABC transporter permease [Desulfovibrio desulfuricans]